MAEIRAIEDMQIIKQAYDEMVEKKYPTFEEYMKAEAIRRANLKREGFHNKICFLEEVGAIIPTEKRKEAQTI